MDSLRFDDAYQKVYEYDSKARAYVFLGSYFAYGIGPDMSEERKRETVEKDRSMGTDEPLV